MPCRIEFTVIGMTVTDWPFMLRCSPPHLAVTQLLRISSQRTFDLDWTFTFLFHNHYGRTRTALGRDVPSSTFPLGSSRAHRQVQGLRRERSYNLAVIMRTALLGQVNRIGHENENEDDDGGGPY